MRGGKAVPAAITPELDLAAVPGGPDLVPSGVVRAPVAGDVGGGRLQRCVHGAVREVQEDRLGRVGGLDGAHHVDGAVGDVVGEVVAVGVAVDGHHVVVLDDAVRLVEVGEGVEDPVEAVEAPLQRPRVLGAGLVLVAVLAQVPLAGHQRGVAVVPQDLGDGGDVVGASSMA